MDSLPSIHEQEDDDIFSDALHQCSADGSPETSTSDPTLSHSTSPSPSPTTTLRRRSIRLRNNQPSDSGTDNDSPNSTRRSFRHKPRWRHLKQDEYFTEKKSTTLSSSIHTIEENNQESTITTATNDDAVNDSVNSVSRLDDSSSSFLELIAGLIIKALEFQIKLIFMFITYPLIFMFRCCLFFMDPFGIRKLGKDIIFGIILRIWSVVFGYIEPYVRKFYKGNESIWSVMFRFGRGILWSIYVCCVLVGLLVSSFVFGWFLMKCFVEKPLRMKEVLNFDYTKLSPVAYVPIISCDGVVRGKDYENGVEVGKGMMMGERVIPSRHKVQVTVSLRVPESGYNRNLGVFQVLAYLSLVHFIAY